MRSLLSLSRRGGVLNVRPMHATEFGIAERIAFLPTWAHERRATMLRRLLCDESVDALECLSALQLDPGAIVVVPSVEQVWLHEVKYDGYRFRVEGDGDRLITRGGTNWSDRYPLILETAHKIRHRRFVIDGEAVVLRTDGVSDFDALICRRHDEDVRLYAFDIL